MDQNSKNGVCSCDCGTCGAANEKHCSSCGKCNCPHHHIVPAMITLIAVVFLLGAFNVLSPRFVEVSWPILLLVAGITKLMRRACTCC